MYTNKITIVIVFIALLFAGCDNGASLVYSTKQSTKNDPVPEEIAKYTIDARNTKVLQTLYIINRNGAYYMQEPDFNSDTLGQYRFGDKVFVIEDGNKWYGVKEIISRSFVKDGNEIESTGWEKVYIPKAATGSYYRIVLDQSDLNIINNLQTDQTTMSYPLGQTLNEYISIELVSKELFDKMKKSKSDLMLHDTLEIRKTNGVINLQCHGKKIVLTDKPDDEEDLIIYDYIGQYDFINMYTICCGYYEDYEFKFIDKISGEEVQSFYDFPYVSPDEKYIISIYANIYDYTADLELFRIFDLRIEPVMSASFPNWMPAEIVEMFWANDGYFYLAATHSSVHWKPDGTLNDNFQYLRIKML